MSKRKAVKPYSSPLPKMLKVEFGDDGQLHLADEANLERGLSDLEALARENLPDLGEVPPARLEGVVAALAAGDPMWPRGAAPSPEVQRASLVLLSVLRLRGALRKADAITAAKEGILLGVLAEQLHAAHLLDLGDKERTAQRRRVKKRWRKTAEARDERNRWWREWNKALLQRVPSERERCRRIATESKKRGDAGASEANVRRVLREAG
jgi:hypothetical protein